ncbi:MAG TPA: asparagine synthase C-terminal domain-containing protein [Nitrososphaerales archaeon]|nr:asparagine synthase C-terminal domain-containing protein [Nitrososphaerales archaeon]
MRTNGFALFKGEGAAALAEKAALRVSRYCKEVLVDAGEGFRELEAAHLSGRKDVTLAFSLERGTLPVVHGYVKGPASLEGEFSLLGEDASGLYGARDPLGTRGLWVVTEGSGAGSIASDYRLLGGGAVLLPPGSAYPEGRARKSARTEKQSKSALSFDEAAGQLASLIDESVRDRVAGQRRVAVSFSGGLDSSILAMVAARHADVVLCSAYASGSRDEKQAGRAADLLGLELVTAVLEEEGLAKTSGGAELPPGEETVMDKALWCIYSATSELAKGNEARTILLGQLADELFGGYMKYAVKAREEGAAAAERMMALDVRACADRGFLRDEAACSASCEVRFPYADERVVSFSAGLPLEFKLREGERKAVLRAAALELGLPEELASAPKKAAQFSSGASKLLKRQ